MNKDVEIHKLNTPSNISPRTILAKGGHKIEKTNSKERYRGRERQLGVILPVFKCRLDLLRFHSYHKKNLGPSTHQHLQGGDRF